MCVVVGETPSERRREMGEESKATEERKRPQTKRGAFDSNRDAVHVIEKGPSKVASRVVDTVLDGSLVFFFFFLTTRRPIRLA